jgi:hypothetical protein
MPTAPKKPAEGSPPQLDPALRRRPCPLAARLAISVPSVYGYARPLQGLRDAGEPGSGIGPGSDFIDAVAATNLDNRAVAARSGFPFGLRKLQLSGRRRRPPVDG